MKTAPHQLSSPHTRSFSRTTNPWLRVSRLHRRSSSSCCSSLSSPASWPFSSTSPASAIPQAWRILVLLCPSWVVDVVVKPVADASLTMVRIPQWPGLGRLLTASLLLTTSPLAVAYNLDPNSTGRMPQPRSYGKFWLMMRRCSVRHNYCEADGGRYAFLLPWRPARRHARPLATPVLLYAQLQLTQRLAWQVNDDYVPSANGFDPQGGRLVP